MSPIDQVIEDGTAFRSVFPNNRPSVIDSGEQPSEQPPMNLSTLYSVMPVDLMVEQEICAMVKSRKQASETHRAQKKLVWDKCWDHMKQIYDKTGKEPWQSTIFQPDTPKVVETIASNLHAALMSPDLPAEWQCKVKDYEERVKSINDIVGSDAYKAKLKLVYTDLLRSLCVVGTSIGKVGYAFEKDMVMVKMRQRPGLAERAMAMLTRRPPPQPMEIYTPQQMVVKDWTTVEYRDPYKIYPQPFTSDFSKDHWVIEDSRITNAELVALANSNDPVSQIKNVTYDLLNSSAAKVDEDPETQARRFALQQQSAAMHYFDPDLPHQLLEYWGPVPVWMIAPEKRNDPAYKYQTVNAWIWVIDGTHCVRASLSPYRDAEPPYFKDTYIRIPGDFWGIGPAELMLGLQIEKNEVVNTGSDQTNLSLNKIIAVIKDKVADWERLKSAPGAMWLFENIGKISDAFQVVEFPDIGRDWYMKIELLDRAIQEVTAANKVTLGVGGGTDEAGGGTFRGQLLNKQSSSERFMMVARSIEFSGLVDCFRKMYHRIYQFKSYESVDRILGKERSADFDFIAPEELDQVAQLVPLGVMTMETKGVKLAQMGEWYKMFAMEPWTKKYELARKMWVEMGYSDPDSVTFTEEELQQFNEFRRQMAMDGLQGPPGGGMPPPGQGSAPSGKPQPIAGNVPPPREGMPMPPLPARGPGAANIDMTGRPMG